MICALKENYNWASTILLKFSECVFSFVHVWSRPLHSSKRDIEDLNQLLDSSKTCHIQKRLQAHLICSYYINDILWYTYFLQKVMNVIPRLYRYDQLMNLRLLIFITKQEKQIYDMKLSCWSGSRQIVATNMNLSSHQ